MHVGIMHVSILEEVQDYPPRYAGGFQSPPGDAVAFWQLDSPKLNEVLTEVSRKTVTESPPNLAISTHSQA